MIANANEESEFSFDNQQIQSLSYQNTKQILFKTKTDKVDFDWPNQTNRLSVKVNLQIIL
jgi:GTP-binding protein EngB required for normal cell division